MIKITTFEGSKGLQAQHVFVVGLQKKASPGKAVAVAETSVRKFIVALTRTRKQCHLMFAKWVRSSGKKNSTMTEYKASTLIDWIDNGRRQFVNVDKDYWPKKSKKRS